MEKFVGPLLILHRAIHLNKYHPTNTPTPTEIRGKFCKEFPFVTGNTNSFTDLSVFVQENFYTIHSGKVYEDDMKFHVNFGDGEVERFLPLKWSDVEQGYTGRVGHFYPNEGLYDAVVLVDNEKRTEDLFAVALKLSYKTKDQKCVLYFTLEVKMRMAVLML